MAWPSSGRCFLCATPAGACDLPLNLVPRNRSTQLDERLSWRTQLNHPPSRQTSVVTVRETGGVGIGGHDKGSAGAGVLISSNYEIWL